MSHDAATPTDIQVPPQSAWAKLPITGAIVGTIGLIATFAAVASTATRDRAMFSYLFAFEVFLGIALGAMGFLLIDYAVRTSWSIVLRRIMETLSATLPLFLVLFIPIATVGLHSLYPWTHHTDEILEKKRWFLTVPFWLVRSAFYLVVWTVLSRYLYSASVRQDSLGNNLAARDAISRRVRTVAAAGILLWGVTQSFQAIDWIMALSPHWYSTIFGVYYFAASILAFFATTALIALGLQRGGMLRQAVNKEHYHDLGKYIFGFTIFWAYIAFSQFMLIWYANIPEETIYYLIRMKGGWLPVSYILPLAHFFLPFFFLLSRWAKRSRKLLAIGAVWTLALYVVDMYWLILPNYLTIGEFPQKASFAPNWMDLTALLGVGGWFAAVFGWFLNRNKVLAVHDPRLPESLVHENY